MASHGRETSLLPSKPFQQEDHDVFSEDYSNNVNNLMVSPKGLRRFESNFGSCGSAYSSWSDFGSPFSISELESTSECTESEEDEELFISELTRRMAEYMLQVDDDNSEIQDHGNSVSNYVPEKSKTSDFTVNQAEYKSGSVFYNNSRRFMNKSDNPTPDSANVKNLKTGIHSDDCSTDEQFPPVQVYQVKNQPQMKKQGSYGGRRVKATESTQQQLQHKDKEQQNMQNKDKAWRYGHGKKTTVPLIPSPPPAGSGMRAVFLGGSERNGSAGTGVFLPSGNYCTPEPKRKSGCSTVLIPARVLQTLQQHFNAVGAQSPSNALPASTNLPWQNDVLARINGLLSQQKEHAEFKTRGASAAAETNHHQDQVKLPQEWTY